VAVDVEHDIIALAGDGRDDAEIGLVAGREDHRMVHPVKVLQRLLDRLVADIGAVEDAAAGGARAELVERLLAGGDDVGIERHAHIIVGAEQDRLAAVADRAGRREDLFHHQPERILDAGVEQRLALGDQIVELGEQIGPGRRQPLMVVGRVDGIGDGFGHGLRSLLPSLKREGSGVGAAEPARCRRRRREALRATHP
jgi:hypothetical protein